MSALTFRKSTLTKDELKEKANKGRKASQVATHRSIKVSSIKSGEEAQTRDTLEYLGTGYWRGPKLRCQLDA